MLANGLRPPIIIRDQNHLMIRDCKWFMSLYCYERPKLLDGKRLQMVYLSITMRDLNHLVVNACKWFTSLYCYERSKLFAYHVLSSCLSFQIVICERYVYHLYVLFDYILPKKNNNLNTQRTILYLSSKFKQKFSIPIFFYDILQILAKIYLKIVTWIQNLIKNKSYYDINDIFVTYKLI